MKALLLVLAVLFTVSCSQGPPSALSLVDARAAVYPMTMEKEEDRAIYCSSVAISDTKALTAAHCVSDTQLWEKNPLVNELAFVVDSIDEKADIAVIALLEGQFPFHIKLLTSNPGPDTPVVAIGYPLGLGIQVATYGRIQGFYSVGSAEFTLATSPVIYGNSGGGLFVQDGDTWELGGIASAVAAMPSDGFFGGSIPIPHLSLWVPVERILTLLGALDAAPYPAATNGP